MHCTSRMKQCSMLASLTDLSIRHVCAGFFFNIDAYPCECVSGTGPNLLLLLMNYFSYFSWCK